MRYFWVLSIFLLMSGCSQGHLFVMEQERTKASLASTKVGSPDPQKNLFLGKKRLVVGWQFPQDILEKKPRLWLYVRFWDQSEEEIIFMMQKASDIRSFFFPRGTILTYLVEVRSEEGELLSVWEHQFWTKLIDVSMDKVVSQLKQESVIDTP